MSVRPTTDVSVAAWIQIAPGWDDWRLITLGPPGFEAYARVLHPLEHGPEDGVGAEGDLEPPLLAALMEVLEPHTTTADDCWHGLWDGYGHLHGGGVLARRRSGSLPSFLQRRPRPPEDAPAFPQAFLDGPKVELPYRSFLLFRGPLGDAGDWGAADHHPGAPRGYVNSPNLLWPSDRAWFVTTDIDSSWTGVAGSRAAIEAVLDEPRLEAVPMAPDAPLPVYR